MATANFNSLLYEYASVLRTTYSCHLFLEKRFTKSVLAAYYRVLRTRNCCMYRTTVRYNIVFRFKPHLGRRTVATYGAHNVLKVRNNNNNNNLSADQRTSTACT